MPASDTLPTAVVLDYITVTSNRINLPHNEIRAAATMLFSDHLAVLTEAGVQTVDALHHLLDNRNAEIIRNMKKMREKSQRDYDNRHSDSFAQAVAFMVAQHQSH